MEEKFIYGETELNIETKPFDIEEAKHNYQEQLDEFKDSLKEHPDTGTIFSYDFQLFKIKYINNGKKRITIEWCGGNQFQSPEIDSVLSIHGKLYKITYCDNNKKRITIEPN